MCGIAGAVGVLDDALASAVRRMNDAQQHRGPDDEGYWQSTSAPGQWGAAFAFRRLAIIDLSPDAHQPMIDAATGNVIIFNGEIYNFHELRRDLEREGAEFKSKSDTEVILKAYAIHGRRAIGHLRGMFAFALWDAQRQETILVRDRLGIKPLYVCELDGARGQTMLFASELRALLASGMVQRRLNRAALSTYIWNGFVVGPETIVEGVRLLPAGTCAVLKRGQRPELHRYWHLPAQTGAKQVPAADAVQHAEAQLQTAVAQHMVSDVPVGVFLSGGIDSSAIAALAARDASAQVRTFNISFDEARFDESEHARAVADALGTDHQEVRLSQHHFRSHLHDALSSLDQPTFDAVNTYFISRAVREAGITVALAGTGGDELFGGYRSFIDLPRAAAWSRRCGWMPEAALQKVGAAVARVKCGATGEIPPQTRWGKLGDGLCTRGRLLELYQTAYSMFTVAFQKKLLNGSRVDNVRAGLPDHVAHDLAGMIDGQASLHAISMLELSCYIGERLLRDTDCASMAVSLEARVPLLDHEVVEAVMQVDEQTRFHPLGQKRLLRQIALRDLDPGLFDRPKSGFELPIDVWCREELGQEIDSIFSDDALIESVGLQPQAVGALWRAFQARSPGVYWSRIWSLYVLLWWCKEHRIAI